MFISVTLFATDDKYAYLIFSAIDNKKKISETIRFDKVIPISFIELIFNLSQHHFSLHWKYSQVPLLTH